jgi:hypothetical protein
MSNNPNKCVICKRRISNSLNDSIKVSIGFFDGDYQFQEKEVMEYFHGKCYTGFWESLTSN